MKFGMNLLLWSGELHDGMIPVLEMLKNLGYDGVEIPLFNTSLDYAAWGRRLDDLGLARTAVTVRGAEDNPISPEAAVRAAGVENTKRVLDCCATVGATTLVGPYHSALGVFTGQGPTADEWKWGVESMRKVAEHAGKVNVTLGVECLNRFESYLLNTHADSARFVRGEPPELSHDVRYVPFEHRGKVHWPGDPCLRRHAVPRAYLGKRPQYARQGQCAVGRELRRAPANQLQRLDDGRGVWIGLARIGRRDQDLAPHVRKRTPAVARFAGVHAGRSRQTLEGVG